MAVPSRKICWNFRFENSPRLFDDHTIYEAITTRFCRSQKHLNFLNTKWIIYLVVTSSLYMQILSRNFYVIINLVWLIATKTYHGKHLKHPLLKTKWQFEILVAIHIDKSHSNNTNDWHNPSICLQYHCWEITKFLSIQTNANLRNFVRKYFPAFSYICHLFVSLRLKL